MNRFNGCIAIAIVLAWMLAACESHTSRAMHRSVPKMSTIQLPEELLFDVGVSVLDSNVPESFDDQVASNTAPEVRRAEANFIPYQLKNLLTSTGNWGAVRVLPGPSLTVDLVVEGKIVHSDGERLILWVSVWDSRGVPWFDRTYESLASKFAYDSSITPTGLDAFQSLYSRIADDLLIHSEALSEKERRTIRLTSLMRYAQDLAPDAFGKHLVENQNGTFDVVRLADEADPSLEQIRNVRTREYLLIDTLDEYFRDFAEEMVGPYQNWRSNTFTEAIAYRQQRNLARTRLIAGTAMMIAGAFMQRSSSQWVEVAGYTNVVGGADEFVHSIKTREQAQIHSEALIELGISAEAEIMPHTIELENKTLTLTGTVDEQVTQMRTILKQLYYEDLGLPIPKKGSRPRDKSSVSDAREK